MGGKTNLKALVLVLSLSFILLFVSSFASGADKCCVTSNSCTDIAANDACPGGTKESSACSAIPDCAQGCCCISGSSLSGSGYVIRKVCTSPYTFTALNPGLNCDDVCSGTTTPEALYKSCDGENNGNYICGQTRTSTTNKWCCAADSGVFPTPQACRQSPSCAQTTTYSISGVVKDSETQSLLSDVTISTGSLFSYSNDIGQYRISYLSSGQVTLTVSKSGYQTYTETLTITSNVSGKTIYLAKISNQENCSLTSDPSSGNWDFDNDGCYAKYDVSCNASNDFLDEGERSLCADNSDNDCDGFYDCQDSNCVTDPHCLAPAQNICGDGVNSYPDPNSVGFNEECESDSDCGANEYCQGCKCYERKTSVCNDHILDSPEEQCDIGYPCQNGQSCDPVTCQCIIGERHCGDGTLQIPQEECDFTSTAFDAVVSGSYCGANACIQPDSAGECLCIIDSQCGDGYINQALGEQCESGNNACPDNRICDFGTCRCEDCSASDKTPMLSNTTTGNTITLSWTKACPESATYQLYQCTTSSGSDCTPNILISSSSPKTVPITTSNNYCFEVKAIYSATESYTSERVCTQPQEFECDNEQDDWFCEGNAVKKCVGGHKQPVSLSGVVQNCDDEANFPGDYVCVDYPGSQKTRCVFQSECDLCNGWYGMFSAKDNQVKYGVTSMLCSAIPSCYLDYTLKSVDKYYECSEISSCYDYKSVEACAGTSGTHDGTVYYDPDYESDFDSALDMNDGDKCRVANSSGGCEWTYSSKTGELGIGVCRPREVEKQDCEECQGYPLNTFYGECNKNLCKQFSDGNCWFDDKNAFNVNSEPYTTHGICVNKRDMGCDYYDNPVDCKGKGDSARNSDLNTVWDMNYPEKPVRGDNTHTTSSNDYFGFGLCIWDEERDACFKDGNGDGKRDCDGATGFEDECVKDMTPPVSQMFFTEPLPKNLGIRYAIEDNGSVDHNYIHYKITSEGVECYPDGILDLSTDERNTVVRVSSDEGFAGEISIDMKQFDTDNENNVHEYTLCWFSEDQAHNFEELHTETITVDADTPEVTYTVIDTPREIVDDSWLSDVNVTVNLMEYASCSIWLTKDAATDYVGGLHIQSQYNRTFKMEYHSLEDGAYIVHAECLDDAGNENTEENQAYEFTLNADRAISDLKPSATFGPANETAGVITIVMEATTLEEADCRYSSEDFEDLRFDDNMESFGTNDGFTHSKTLTFRRQDIQDGQRIFRYYVKCKSRAKGVIYGNSGDLIEFAVDYIPPITRFVDSQGKDVSISDDWHRNIDFYLKCTGEALYYNNNPNNKNWAAGCKEVRYTSDGQPGFGNPAHITLPESGTYDLTHYSIDSVDNMESTQGPKTLKVDNEQYSFDIIIYDGENDVTTVAAEKTYTINIISSKEFKGFFDCSYNINITSFGFEVGADKFYLETVDTFTPVCNRDEGENQRWSATLRLNPADSRIQSLPDHAQATFFIKAKDGHNIESSTISSGREFLIDIIPPGTPELEPTFEESAPNNYEYYYGTLFEEKFNAYNGKYYTNDKYLYVTGKTPSGGNIIYYNLRSRDAPFATYNQMNNAAQNTYTKPRTSGTAQEGSKFLMFNQDITQSFTSESYIDAGEPRKSYLHWKEYYKVNYSEAEGTPTKTTLWLMSALEYAVNPNTEIKVYQSPHPYNWFGYQLNLNPGWNNLSIYTRDEAGNYAETPTYEIFFDNQTPRVLGEFPINSTITGSNDTQVSINIQDIGAGIELSTITLKINTEEYQSDDLMITNTTNDIGGGQAQYTYTITYPNKGGFGNGVYNVKFKAYDLAKNKVEKNWTFKIDTNLPETPEFWLYGQTKEDNYDNLSDMWYTNNVTDLMVRFDGTTPVQIKSIDLERVGTTRTFETNITDCSPTSFNEFRCAFKLPKRVTPDNEYYLKINAHKILTHATGEDGSYPAQFTMDTIAPVFNLIYDNTTNSNASMNFTAIIDMDKSPEKVLRAYLQIEGESNQYPLQPISGLEIGSAQYLYHKPFGFTWNVADRPSSEFNFIFILKDLAGNYNSTTRWILVDNQIPLITIESINSTQFWVNRLDPETIVSFDEIPRGQKENARYKGVGISIIGTITPNDFDGHNGEYDTRSIRITKRTENGTIIGEAKTISKCAGQSPAQQKDCFYNGRFYADIPITEPNNDELTYYLLFEVEDEAENTGLYVLMLIADTKAPNAPDIDIINDQE